MRIDELKFPENIRRAAVYLEQYGYKRLGNKSSYGWVFHKEGETSVLKLYNNSDHAYTEFVDFCRQHQDNKHFPKFSRSTIAIKGTEYRAVRTELLKEGNSSKFMKLARYFNIMRGMIRPPMKVLLELEEWQGANRSLTEAFQLLIKQFGRDSRFVFDLHHQNMMMRKSTVVIIDPLVPAL